MSLTPVPDLGNDNDEHLPRTIHRYPMAPPNPVQVEIDILRFLDELEDRSVEYHQICRDAAMAEAEWKLAQNRALTKQMLDKRTERMKVAQAELEAVGAHRTWLLAQRRQQSSYAYLTYLKTRIEALRTLSANYRRAEH